MRKHQQESNHRQPPPQISFESLLFGEPDHEQNPADPRESPSLFAPEDFPKAPEPDDEIAGLSLPERPRSELVAAPEQPQAQEIERRRRRPVATTPLEASQNDEPEGEEKPRKTDLARQKVEEGIKALAAELQAGHSEALLKWLETMSRFHTYSLNNTLLIAWQRPEAMHVAGFHTWKDLGRTVKKGEKGIMILAPIPKRSKTENTDEGGEERQGEGASGAARREAPLRGEVWGFRVAYVFDIEQTEGEDLPQFAQVRGDPADHLERLKALVKTEGIGLEYAKGLQGAFGVSLKGTIKLLEGMTPAHEFSVLAHELAHELLHKDPKRRAETTKTVRETEAEAIAFIVCRGIGLETSQQHSDYIKLYRGDVETLTASLEAIRETSARILGAIEERKTPERKERPEGSRKPQERQKRGGRR